ncbi:hypothetical protein F383_24314 [Gossypium arboreum]|uniref:Uncharacterized protein n=1 Tax=Gossypium arboreum TaxID=29729 RepID=A0A0B0MK57_GOSAR|nr:hypothetical protein F383_24314 [Gossypium arboreum]
MFPRGRCNKIGESTNPIPLKLQWDGLIADLISLKLQWSRLKLNCSEAD